ncbi:MAG: hypothetical protein AB1750_10815 [Chloroflexota bacterium]
MAHLLVFVLDNVDQYPAILEAWESAGIPGVTILDSTGLGHLRERLIRDDLPLMPSLGDLLPSQEINHRTLFSVIEDEAVLKRVIAATQNVVGDFTRHHTGLLFVVPVTMAIGLEKRGPE